MELADDDVLVVPRVGSDSPLLTGPRQIPGGIEVDQETNRGWAVEFTRPVVEHPVLVWPPAIQVVQVEEGCPQIQTCGRIFQGCRVERDVVIKELTEEGEPDGHVWVLVVWVPICVIPPKRIGDRDGRVECVHWPTFAG